MIPIRVENLTKKLGDFTLDNFNLEIKRGEYFVLLGPSGSGKTVSMELISGLCRPDSGYVYGTDRRKIGFIYQDYMLFPHMNVFDNISYGLRIKKNNKDDIRIKVEKISEKLGIGNLLYREIEGLSGGEKQRVAIARAMIIDPEICFLDEPTSSLDRSLKREARDLFRSIHRESGRTFFHVTHDFEEALSLGDRIGVLFNGKLVQVGTPEELYSKPVSGRVADFIGYRNVWSGTVKDYVFRKNGIGIGVPLKECESAYAAIRPDEIIISDKIIHSSARNTFKGTVEKIIQSVSSAEVIVDSGIRISVEITRRSLSELKLKKGSKVFVTFKVSSVKVFER